MIIYKGKILEGLAPNLHIRIIPCWNNRLRKMSKLNPLQSRNAEGNIRENSIRGLRLFNLLAKNIRIIVGKLLDIFKTKLDSFLQVAPDQTGCKTY